MPDQITFSGIGWPLATVMMFAVFLVMFRDPIVRFIDRIRSVSKEGVHSYDDVQRSAPGPSALAEFLGGFHSPLFHEVESGIDKLIQDQGLTDSADVRKALLTMLARAVIFGEFEGVHSSIFASQISALNFLNAQAAPVSKATLEVNFYNKAVTDFPSLYRNRTFGQWLDFLLGRALVVDADAGVSISARGMEFLKWRVDNRRAVPWIG